MIIINLNEGFKIVLDTAIIIRVLRVAWLLVFLPYLGPLAGISIVTIVTLFTFDSIGRILLAPAIYIAVEIIQGLIISPTILGLRFSLNPPSLSGSFFGDGFEGLSAPSWHFPC